MNKKVPKSVSNTIKMLRFPLIVVVVLVHAYSTPDSLPDSIGIGDPQFINLFIQSLFSDVFGRLSVPTYFLISGYLIYYGAPLTKSLIKRKWRSRVFTLLIPYFIWNFAALAVQIVGQIIPQTSRFFTGSKFDVQTASLYTVADAFLGISAEPINTPLWFLRDLMILILLSPLIYYLVSKMGKILIPVFLLIWLEIPFTYPIFISPRGLLFFSLGMWLALKEEKIKLKSENPIYIIAAFLFLSTAAVEAYLITQATNVFYLHQFNVALGCLTMPILFYRIGQHPRISKILTHLAPTSYMIYLSHNIIVQIVRKLLSLIVDPISGAEYLVIYFGTTLITLLILVLFYEIFVNRLSNRVVKFSIGQRTT